MRIRWTRVFVIGLALLLTLGCGTCQVAGCVAPNATVTQTITGADTGEGMLWALAVLLVVATIFIVVIVGAGRGE